MDMVILVDTNDNAVGTMEKMEAHRQGKLHRAFSIILYNSQGQMLLQKRASSKYHSGGLWTNACCSHPVPGEQLQIGARRRLREEMGIDVPVEYSHKFIYKAKVNAELTEHELDHVLTGTFDGEPSINTDEVEAWKFVDVSWLKEDVNRNPSDYTYWFRILVTQLQPNS